MAKTGNINTFSVAEIFHLISSSLATGGLLIKGESIATVNFHLGELVYVGVEGFSVRLGGRLVKEGCLSEEQLQEILQEQQRTKPWRSIGSICLEKKLLNSTELNRILQLQMTAMIAEILKWKEGMFRFERGEVSISDPISLSCYDLWNQLDPIGRAGKSFVVEWAETAKSTDDVAVVIEELRKRYDPWKEEFFRIGDASRYETLLTLRAMGEILIKQLGSWDQQFFLHNIRTAMPEISANLDVRLPKPDGNWLELPLTGEQPNELVLPAELLSRKSESSFVALEQPNHYAMVVSLFRQPVCIVTMNVHRDKFNHSQLAATTWFFQQLAVAIGVSLSC